MIPIIEKNFVQKRHLLKQSDILNMIAITQTIPGLIAINSAVFVGHKLAGWKGSLVATLGVISPSIFIIICIAKFFPLEQMSDNFLLAFSCVRACVLGMFIALAYKIVRTILKSKKDIAFLFALLMIFFFQLNPILVILFTCIIGVIYESYKLKNKEKRL